MDLIKLRYFVSAAQCGSFSEAARRQYTSQPNISKQISSLETELGVKLFIRDNRNTHLTKAGEYLYEQIWDLPIKLEQIFDTARALSRGDTGAVTIGLLAGQRLNSDIMAGFRRFTSTYPDLDFTLERAGFSSLREALESFRYDMVITLGFDVQDSPDLTVESIGKQSMAMFVSRMSPIADVTDLATAPLIAISPKESYGGYDRLVQFCRRRGFEPNIVRLADSLDNLLFYVEAGVGAAVLDRNIRLEADSDIRVLPMDGPEDEDMVAVWLRSNTNPNIRKMVDCLKGT